MRVILAGYNVDAETLAELTAGQNRQDVTPETLSAAYARISRDPRPVDELRKVARSEVEKARCSNSTIIFKMGHHSVAEHAVFNFDILDVSRLALEEIEKFRLCSYTEKSQRYQKLENNFIVPEEIKKLGEGKAFLTLVEKQNAFYHKLVESGVEPEDARYVTPMATCGQLGMTLNARNLELMVRRFASSPLAEVQELGRKIYEAAAKIAPSIILFTAANDYDQKTYPELRQRLQTEWQRKRRISAECLLVDCPKDGDLKVLAALLQTVSQVSFANCRRIVKDMKQRERLKLIKQALRYMEFYDVVPRELEHVSLTFDLLISASCFAQMKRHRMATLTSQNYDPALGLTVPPKFKELGRLGEFTSLVKETEDVFKILSAKDFLAATYVLTGAHRKRLLMTVNARELYHISRLREDIHAQWDIRGLTAKMTAGAKKALPLTMLLLGGKHEYPVVYKTVYGTEPKVKPPTE